MSSPKEDTPAPTEAPTNTTNAKDKCETTEETEKKTIEPANSFNPTLSDEDEEKCDLERMKGDAIGNTLFSERFVLKTLIKLNKNAKDLSDDSEFEDNLCSLWDMTIEEDVVHLLLEHDVLNLFAETIDTTADKRLTEILVGMIANMACMERTREELCSSGDVMATLLALTSCSDTLTLVQLMRLITALLVPLDSEKVTAEMWFKHFRAAVNFVPELTFILSNSINESLLQHTLEALNAALAKFADIERSDEEEEQAGAALEGGDADSAAAPGAVRATAMHSMGFADVFVHDELVKATTEAFQALNTKYTQTPDDDDDDGPPEPNQASRKNAQCFLNIHCILTESGCDVRTYYEPHLAAVSECLDAIMAPLCVRAYLLPLSEYEEAVVEKVNDVSLALGDPFAEVCFTRIFTIWDLTITHQESRAQRAAQAAATGGAAACCDFENSEDNSVHDADEVDVDALCVTMFDFMERHIAQVSSDKLEKLLSQFALQTARRLLAAFGAGAGDVGPSAAPSAADSERERCRRKMKMAIEKLEQKA